MTALKTPHLVALWGSILLSSCGYCLTIDQLPPDKSSGLDALALGEIDPAVWEMVEPFYDNPMDLASGDLPLLTEMFPYLNGYVPADSALEHYRPWTFSNRRQFFRDYPELIAFQPIISFSKWTEQRIAMVRVDSRLRSATNDANQTLRFSISDQKRLTAKATLKFDHQTARWQRRTIVLEIPERVFLQIGNTGGMQINSLAYGRFGKDQSSLESSTLNWLYGSSRSWNGFYASIPFYAGIKIQGGGHYRLTERIAFLQARIPVASRLSLTGGISYSLLKESFAPKEDRGEKISVNDRGLKGHLDVQIDQKPFRLNLSGDILGTDPGSIPFKVIASYRKTGEMLSVRVVFFPAECVLPLSKEYNSLSSRVSSKGNEAITLVEMMPRFNVSDLFSIRARYSLVKTSSLCRFDLSNTLSRGSPVELSLHHRISSSDGNVVQKIALTQSNTIGECLQLSLQPSVRLAQDTISEAAIEISTELKMFSSLFAAPLISVKKRIGMAPIFKGGITLKVELFDKTYGMLGIHGTCDDKQLKGGEIRGQTSFCF